MPVLFTSPYYVQLMDEVREDSLLSYYHLFATTFESAFRDVFVVCSFSYWARTIGHYCCAMLWAFEVFNCRYWACCFSVVCHDRANNIRPLSTSSDWFNL